VRYMFLAACVYYNGIIFVINAVVWETVIIMKLSG